jgi:hypothetical protein
LFKRLDVTPEAAPIHQPATSEEDTELELVPVIPSGRPKRVRRPNANVIGPEWV